MTKKTSRAWSVIGDIAYCASVAYVVSCTVSLLFIENSLHEVLFSALGGLRMNPPFADLRAITSTAGCGVDLTDAAAGIVENCDPYGRRGGLGYPPFIFKVFRILGLWGETTEAYGAIAGILIVSTIHTLTKRLRRVPAGKLFASVLMVGFPVSLIIERGNIDGTVFLSLLAVGLILEKERESGDNKATMILGMCLSFSVSAAKIYPGLGIIAWVVWGLRSSKFRADYPSAFKVGLAAMAGLLSCIPWLLSGDTSAKPGVGIISHGLSWQIGSGTWGNAAGVASYGIVAVTIAVSLLCVNRTREKAGALCGGAKRMNAGTWLTAASWLACYMLNINYDYRFILAYPVLIVVLNSLAEGSRNYAVAICGATGLLQVISPSIYLIGESSLGKDLASNTAIGAIGINFLRYAGFWINRGVDVALMPFCGGLLIAMAALHPYGRTTSSGCMEEET